MHHATRLFVLIYAVGTVVTIFMSNDATAVVLTPAVLAAVKKARTEPLPYLLICAFIANAASFVLPISNPANLVVFHQGHAAAHGMASNLRAGFGALHPCHLCRVALVLPQRAARKDRKQYP